MCTDYGELKPTTKWSRSDHGLSGLHLDPAPKVGALLSGVVVQGWRSDRNRRSGDGCKGQATLDTAVAFMVAMGSGDMETMSQLMAEWDCFKDSFAVGQAFAS